MSKKSKNGTRKQVVGGFDSGVERRVGQMLLPMVAGIAATRHLSRMLCPPRPADHSVSNRASNMALN